MKKKPMKFDTGIQWLVSGWRLYERVRHKDAPPGVPGRVMTHQIHDPDHEMTRKELKDALIEWKSKWRELVNSKPWSAKIDLRKRKPTMSPSESGGGVPINQQIDEYLKLPQVARLECAKDGHRFKDGKSTRERMLRELATQISARLGHEPDMYAVKKKDWELLLGAMQESRGWAEQTFNNWKFALQDFYTEMNDPDDPRPNPVSFIEPQVGVKKAPPRAISYAQIKRVVTRLVTPRALGQQRIALQQDALARQLAAKGTPIGDIARHLGVSYNAIRKLLMRKPPESPEQTERIGLMLRAMAYTGIRPVQLKKIDSEHFKPESRSVWVTQSLKRDNSFEKQLSAQGLAALQAVHDANAWGDYDNKRANTLLKLAWRAEKLPEPAPSPYRLRHSYITAALKAGVSPEELCLDTGHTTPEQIIKTYGTGAHEAIRRRVAARFDEQVEKEQGKEERRGRPRKAAGDVVLFAKKAAPAAKPARKVTYKLRIAEKALRRKA